MWKTARILSSFTRCPAPRRKLLLESVINLVRAHSMIRLLNFKRVAKTLVYPPKSAAEVCDVNQCISEIAWAVNRAARSLPLPLPCFARAVAAQAMCRRRGIETTLYYGASARTGILRAHVWLKHRELGIVGHNLAGEYKLLATFPSRKESARMPRGEQ